MAQQVALVTGASSGIGEQTARTLQKHGFTVYGAARRVDRMQALADSGIHVLALDVTDQDSCRAAVDTIITETGRIDVLVNNAGYGSYGAIEDVPPQEAQAQFDVNVFGAMQLVQAVLPHMRAQRSGTIVNVSSMGGKIYTPFGGWYHATKFALEALSDCLRVEVKPFGIRVVVIEPGGIRTEWGGIAAENLRKTSGTGPYAGAATRLANVLGRETRLASPPSVVANAIAKAVTAKRPRTRYAIGAGAKPAVIARRLLPDRFFDAVIGLALRERSGSAAAG